VLGDEDSWTKVASDACLSLKTPIWSQISTYLELGAGGAGGEGTSGWVELETVTIISSSWCKSQSCIFLLLKAFRNCTEEGNQSVTTTAHPMKDVYDNDAQPT